MENSATTRERISALVDGEINAGEALHTIGVLREPLHCQTWDVYHQIGDTLRSESMAAPLSKDFSLRFAAKLEAEPLLLPPDQATRRIQAWPKIMHRRKWFGIMPAGLAAAAAAVFAFVIAPNLMSRFDSIPRHMADTYAVVPTPDSALLAEAAHSPERTPTPVTSPENYADISQYIEVHQSSHTSLYGSARLAQPTALVTAADK